MNKIKVKDILHDLFYGLRNIYKIKYYAKQAEILGEQGKYTESLEANDKLREILEGFRIK